MSVNSRFAVAIHILGFIAFAEQQRGDPVPSDMLAQSANTNPVVIRRLLGSLRDAGLVTSQLGSGGGWRLLRSPDAITLGQVYRAVKDGPLFALPPRRPDPHCLVGRNVECALDQVFGAAEDALTHHLAQTTIADVVHDITAVLAQTCPQHAQPDYLDSTKHPTHIV